MSEFDAAFTVWRDKLDVPMVYHINSGPERLESLKAFLPNGVGGVIPLDSPHHQACVVSEVALAYSEKGEIPKAIETYRRAEHLLRDARDELSRSANFYGLSNTMRLGGRLFSAEAAADCGLKSARAASGPQEAKTFLETMSLLVLGAARLFRGDTVSAIDALTQAESVNSGAPVPNSEGLEKDFPWRPLWILGWLGVPDRRSQIWSYLAQAQLWEGDPMAADGVAEAAWHMAEKMRIKGAMTRAARVRGLVLLAKENAPWKEAESWLTRCLNIAGEFGVLDESIAATILLAELHRRRNRLERCRELLDDVLADVRSATS